MNKGLAILTEDYALKPMPKYFNDGKKAKKQKKKNKKKHKKSVIHGD